MRRKEDDTAYDIALGYYYDNLMNFIKARNLSFPMFFRIEVIPLFGGLNGNINITEGLPNWLRKRKRKILSTYYRIFLEDDDNEAKMLYITVE